MTQKWKAFCRALGLERLADDPRFRTMKDRTANYSELRPEITRLLKTMTRAEAIARMAAANVPAGPVNTVGEVLEDPQIQAREMVQELIHPEYGPLRLLGIPVKLSDTPGSLDSAPPRFGEHNGAILSELGYSSDLVRTLTEQGVISAS